MACNICSLLAASKDYIGTHCLACGALLPGDKFEEEVRSIIEKHGKSHIADENIDDLYTALADKRYAGVKLFHYKGVFGNPQLHFVRTLKMLEEEYPDMRNYDVNALFVANVTKNIYTACAGCKVCNAPSGSLIPCPCKCGKMIFKNIMKYCHLGIERYRKPAQVDEPLVEDDLLPVPDKPEGPTDPYPALTAILNKVDVYATRGQYHFVGLDVPAKYSGVPLYVLKMRVAMSGTKSAPLMHINDVRYHHDPDKSVVTMGYLHSLYPELAQYDHSQIFAKDSKTGVRMLLCDNVMSNDFEDEHDADDIDIARAYQQVVLGLQCKEMLSAIERD